MAIGLLRSITLAAATAATLTACGTAANPAATSTTRPASPGAPTVETYPGDGVSVTIRNVQKALSQTSPEFRTFITKRLHQLWVGGGSVPGCQGSALISVTAYRSDGFASASDEGLFGSDTCARGGNSALYAKVAGTWKEIIGTQSGYACADLKKFKVPTDVAGSSCLDANGNPHPYSG